VIRHRELLERQGIVRLDVQVRGVVDALNDPAREAEARAVLRKRLMPSPAIDPKALLAAAPLAGIDIERQEDAGRPAER
jgi:hypothetical protein